jgi:molybdenum cofactor cytidylyltransferase/nicotine blue oxidoreductase
MGYPKALLPFGNELFLTHILRILKDAGMAKPRIILGKAAPQIISCIRHWSADIIVNKNPDRGQLSSIQLGISDLDPEFAAAMIWPVDQPAVSADVVQCLVRLFVESEQLMAFPQFEKRRGHPAIFDRSLFQEFMDAPLAEGPKSILLKYRNSCAILDTKEVACFQDIDTPAEYQALMGESLDSIFKKAGANKKD